MREFTRVRTAGIRKSRKNVGSVRPLLRSHNHPYNPKTLGSARHRLCTCFPKICTPVLNKNIRPWPCTNNKISKTLTRTFCLIQVLIGSFQKIHLKKSPGNPYPVPSLQRAGRIGSIILCFSLNFE